MTLNLVLLLLGSYLLGAIPFGVLIARTQGVDIMKVGSGNTGATNVMRVLGKGPGYAVFVLDTLKGLVPTLVGRWLFPDRQEFWFLAGALAIIGHSFSPFLKFRGGKGISSALGMTIGTSPIVALCAFVVFATTLGTTRFMSLASIFAIISTIPFGFLFKDSSWVLMGYSAMVVFIVYRHRANIKRLKDGTEPKFKFDKSVDVPPESSKSEDDENRAP